MGTIPDTPGPIKKAAEETASPCPMRVNDMPMSSPSTHGPLPTPMPGTNLSFEDIQMEPPAIIVSSPSVPFMDGDGYFAIPTARVQTVVYNAADVQLGAEQLTASAPNPASPSTHMSEPSQKGSLEVPRQEDVDPYALDEEARKSLERKAGYVTAYLGSHDALPRNEDSADLVRRRSTWGRHTGLYDGTGYASECVEDDAVGSTAFPKTNTPELPAAPNSSPAEGVDQPEQAQQCPVSPSRMTGGPGPIISSSEPAASRSPSAGSGPGPTVDQEDKEALQDIIRAYSVYHTPEREDFGRDTDNTQGRTQGEDRYPHNCNRSEVNVSARSTSTTLVGSN